EIRRLGVNVVLYVFKERGPYVGRGIQNEHIVERREPRHLRQQSKGGSDHHVLQRARALLGAARPIRTPSCVPAGCVTPVPLAGTVQPATSTPGARCMNDSRPLSIPVILGTPRQGRLSE